MRPILVFIYAGIVELVRKSLMLSERTMQLIYIPGINRLRHYNGLVRAYAEHVKAKRRVPAYQAFLLEKGFTKVQWKGITPLISTIPATDKNNYVKRYSIDERCIYGRIPETGVVIDESSGSSGTATNWARGKKERKRNAAVIRFGVRNLFGKDPLFIINAFALGPWATGVNITMSCVSFSRLKSLGPDKVKIENTIRQFGELHRYLVMGYPPFLKMLVDESDIDWHRYDVSFVFGGESMSEGMRDYLKSKGIRKVYSSFGASDLELNISAENEFTVSLRGLLRSNHLLREKLLRYTGALPMIFQYNPSDFLIESIENGELVITICRPGYISPKIRYNIYDKGHILQLSDVFAAMKELDIDEHSIIKPQTDLPLLFHYGRADMTVAFFGANISPVDIQEALYNLKELAPVVNSYCLAVEENTEGDKHLIVSMEWNTDQDQHSGPDVCERFYDQLALVNQDFREARKMTKAGQTQLLFYKRGEGPFAQNDIRIKAKYLSS